MIFADTDRNDAAIVSIVFGILGVLTWLVGLVIFARGASQPNPNEKRAKEVTGAHVMMSAFVTAIPAFVCLALVFMDPFDLIRSKDGARPLYITSMVFGLLGFIQLGHGAVSLISAKMDSDNLLGVLEKLQADMQFGGAVVPMLIFIGCFIPLLVKLFS